MFCGIESIEKLNSFVFASRFIPIEPLVLLSENHFVFVTELVDQAPIANKLAVGFIFKLRVWVLHTRPPSCATRSLLAILSSCPFITVSVVTVEPPKGIVLSVNLHCPPIFHETIIFQLLSTVNNFPSSAEVNAGRGDTIESSRYSFTVQSFDIISHQLTHATSFCCKYHETVSVFDTLTYLSSFGTSIWFHTMVILLSKQFVLAGIVYEGDICTSYNQDVVFCITV
jgi:hypothetical protein